MEGSFGRTDDGGNQDADEASVRPELLTADLSPRQAAQKTGLSRTLIYREIERGHLRAYKVGGRLRVTPEALGEWKRLHAVMPRSPAPAYEPPPAAAVARGSSSFASDLRAIRQERAA